MTTTKSFIIGKEGRIKGTVRASHVIVSGLLEGECESEIVEILSGGKISGSIISNDFSIDKGGYFAGESHVNNSDAIIPILQDKTDAKFEVLSEDAITDPRRFHEH